jgi:hypothetical protein
MHISTPPTFSADRAIVVLLTLSSLLLGAELVWWAMTALLPR